MQAGEAQEVAVLMGCRDGARFLPEQLASIAAQSHRRWRLFASDDGSTDATRAILADFAAAHPGRVEIREGPRRGFAANYLALAGDPAIRAGWYAFADQDDVWHPERLARGIARLAALPGAGPRLYGGRTVLIDEGGRETGRSPRFRTPPGFGNALVQSIAGGNTMLFDPATKELLERARPETVVAHDWWIYILVSGAGGRGGLRPRAHGALPPARGEPDRRQPGLRGARSGGCGCSRAASSPSTATSTSPRSSAPGRCSPPRPGPRSSGCAAGGGSPSSAGSPPPRGSASTARPAAAP